MIEQYLKLVNLSKDVQGASFYVSYQKRDNMHCVRLHVIKENFIAKSPTVAIEHAIKYIEDNKQHRNGNYTLIKKYF